MDTSESISNSTNGDTVVANENEMESDLDQASISELLAEDPSLLEGEDVTELFQRLSSADSMTKEMESKIDNVLNDLDELLALLGAEEIPTTSEDTNSTSSPDTTKLSSDSVAD
jgi:dynactin complex subunit